MAARSSVLTPIFGTVLSWLGRRRLPRVSGRLRLRSLEGVVEVLRDRWGVPHIYAQSVHDVMFAQGYVHAQERLWQMDWSRRLAAGRLAEVLGEAALPLDRWVRILGLRRAAEAALPLLDGEPRAWVEAYVAGVNACMAREPLPIEFTLLRYEPEPWTAVDSLSWGKVLGWNLSTNWEAELLRARLIARIGAKEAAALEPPYPDRCPYILPPGTDYSDLGDEALRRARRAADVGGLGTVPGIGSNNWVLAGTRTASGKPILANDMHLILGVPAIWYENHLSGGGLEVTGVTFPGVPGVVAGHNAHVAWGFTNGFPDVQDLYMERLRRLEDGRVQYELRGEWRDARVVHEAIRVRGGKTVTEEVIITGHGPIINALAPDLAGEQPLALRWTGHDPDAIIRALHGMDRARSCDEFYEALRHWSVPVQNTVYADTEGNIGFCHAGRVPIRAAGDGRVPVPGWTGEYEWTGYIPFEHLPHLHNPPQGYIVTANNRVVGDDYPYWLGNDHCTGDRAQRIIELIEARERTDLGYVQEMQFDQLSPAARAVAAHLARLEPADGELTSIVQVFCAWDGQLDKGSVAAALFELFIPRFVQLALKERLGDLTAHYLGKGPTPVLAETTMLGCRAWEWVERALSHPTEVGFDAQTRDRLAAEALREVAAGLREELGPDMANWTWGRLHRLTFEHLLGRSKLLAPFFNRGPYPVGGDATTIWATGPSTAELRGETLTGPPYRFIVDLGDPGRSLSLLAPGQSGHPVSPHYDDQIEAWFSKGYHPMLFERKEVEREAGARLVLEPAP
ncbi:MAG: penicillin acylase family protein [Anaerolineae bacterium]|nr:penicillin acylase family protein [Anaerolineae bacterium]